MHVRKATMADVESMFTLICHYAEQGLLLSRSLQSLYEHLQVFSVVVTDDNEVAGVAGLHILWGDLAEIRSLAVAPDYQGMGLGRMLVEFLIQQAKELQISRVLALTYQIKFFEKLQFSVVKKETLPQKVWKDCINCPKFSNCDEVALVFQIPMEVSYARPYEIPDHVRNITAV